MTNELRLKVIRMLKQILLVEDEEIRQYAIESLIEMLEEEEEPQRK
jgi:hypothetical protein